MGYTDQETKSMRSLVVCEAPKDIEEYEARKIAIVFGYDVVITRHDYMSAVKTDGAIIFTDAYAKAFAHLNVSCISYELALRASSNLQAALYKKEGYESLATVLDAALDQAACGKGAERHGNGLPFDQQPMQQIASRRGIGFILGQADKKSEEAQGMLERGEIDAFEREILGAINYLAGAIIFARNKQ